MIQNLSYLLNTFWKDSISQHDFTCYVDLLSFIFGEDRIICSHYIFYEERWGTVCILFRVPGLVEQYGLIMYPCGDILYGADKLQRIWISFSLEEIPQKYKEVVIELLSNVFVAKNLTDILIFLDNFLDKDKVKLRIFYEKLCKYIVNNDIVLNLDNLRIF